MKQITHWRKLPVSLAELCIDTTLRCGQSFRWRKIDDEWTCTLHGRILSLKQDDTYVHYKTTWPNVPAQVPLIDDTEALLRHYFSLHLDLRSLYDQWSKDDPNFGRKAPEFSGVRILSQDAWEALLCFICSSNNNISRICQMAHKLCKYYGPLIAHIGDEAMHDFPTPEALTGTEVESHLRELGFGYRAKYIVDTARIIALEKPAMWLETLRNPEVPSLPSQKPSVNDSPPTYKEAHSALLTLKGVGPKVADCVCLMGLGWGESVPVDTHIWQIAQRDYKFGKTRTKTFNKATYDAVGDHFRAIWGKYAGWAHSVLFTADLREFANPSPKKAIKTMIETKIKLEEEESPPDKMKRTVLMLGETVKIETKGLKREITEESGQTSKRRRTRSRP